MVSSALAEVDFSSEMMRDLVDLGPFDTDLCLELGLSLWLHRSGTTVAEARGDMLAIRSALIEVSGLDRSSEPFPLIGRSPELDLVILADYLAALVDRAAAFSGIDADTLAERALAQF